MKLIAACALSMAMAWSASIAAAAPAAAPSRQDAVAQRGTSVMPFDLDATTHVFSRNAAGGVQQVVAKRADDGTQVKLIRMHLQQIAAQFRKRDFSGPAHIHGNDMPGLAQLRAAGQDALTLQYRDIEGGGQITYTSEDPQVRAALHQWFDAQLSDHGRHAVGGHDHSRMRH